ncbi:hypothetical protein C2G38_2056434 [Gigaspora rosea]|uniref:Chromo domain-containing protein n=1 Tax=Gigaspora rosea TaxID=44941 RepID=A0A397W4D9_9GLOM|nr:hypothetical protein C2G38_2056434 [Gigaspora rosea]
MTKKKKQDRLSEEDEVYAAMCILAEKHDEQNSVMYLVKWAGHDQNGNEWEPTWEPYENCGTLLIHEWIEKKEREKNGVSENHEQNYVNAMIINERKNGNINGKMDNVEKIDDVCQSRQINGINGKKKKLHHLYATPNTANNIMSIGRSLFWDDGNQNNDVISESSRSSSSKRTIFRKDSTKDADLDDNHKRSVFFKSRQVKIFKSFSSKSKLSVNSSRRVPNGNISSSSDSEQEIHHYMNGNGASQFYKYPLRSQSGRISITRRLGCSSINKRKVSPRSFDGRISDDLDSRKKFRYDEDSYSSEEEILCSGQAIPCSPITPIITHSPKNDTDIDDLYVSPIPKTTNIKNIDIDKSVSISTPKSTISPSTNSNMNGSQELAQKSSNDLGITSANPSSIRPTDLHHSIQNKANIPTNQHVNINVNMQSSETSLPKPSVQTARTDAILKNTQKRTQTKARKLPLKPDAVKNSSQLTVNSSNTPILPKPPSSIPMIRPTSLINNNTNIRSVQNRTIRPNSDLYSNYSKPILPDDNHNKVTLKDAQGSAVIADHGQHSRNMLHAPLIGHKSQTSPLGVGLSSLQLENSVATTNTINCNTMSNFRGKTNIQSFQDIHNATGNHFMKSELIEQRKTIERQTEQLSKVHKALAEKSEECESLKYTINNITTDESLKRDNESLKQENESLKRENEQLKMFWAKFIQSGVSFSPRDYSRMSELNASIQTLIDQNYQNYIAINQLPRTQNTSSSSSPDVLRSKLNQSQLKVSLLERTLQMKDENEKVCQQTTKLILDLKLEPLRNYVELQNNARALIPSSLLEIARMNTDHTTTRGDTSINISTSRNSNDTLSSNITTSNNNNINPQTDNYSFNTDSNSNSVRGMDVVDNPTTTKILESSVTTDRKGKSIFYAASRKIVASTSNGMPNLANIGHRKPNKYAREELFCHWNWCNMSFKTKPDLKMHVLSFHFQEHEKDLKPYVRTLD